MIDDEVIVQAGRTLALHAGSPSLVVLFGSRARGEARPDSDLDFLVIEEHVESKLDEMVLLRDALAGLDVPDVLRVGCRHDPASRSPTGLKNAAVQDAYSIVRQAVLDKDVIVATYRGHRREMCPHVLGTKAGRRQALFFQFAGSSGSGLPQGGEWRCIPIDGLSDVTSQPGEWMTGRRPTRPQTCVDDVDVEVAY